MSLETGQILQDSGLSATISQLWGPKSDLWQLFLAHELLWGCPPHARGANKFIMKRRREAGSDPPQRLHHMLGGGSRPPQHLHHMLGGGSWPRTPPETRGQALRALDFAPHFAAFSRGKIILWSYMSLETGQIPQDIGLSATISQLWGQNRLSGGYS